VSEIAEILLKFRGQASYVALSDFIFAISGKPRWGGIMHTDHIKPAAERAGIGKVGWHTFRPLFVRSLGKGENLTRAANIF
jgi:hypothetical protein